MNKVKEHIHRYFVAVYGEEYVYRAPELFPNALERWMLSTAAGNEEVAEECIKAIENHFEGINSVSSLR